MDLADFGTDKTAEAGAVLKLLNPQTGAELVGEDKKPVFIKLASSDSERVKRVTRHATNLRLQQARSGRANVTAEGLESENLKALVAATIDWGNIALEGEMLQLNDDNARRVYTELPWLRKQAQAFMDEEGNFVKRSAGN